MTHGHLSSVPVGTFFPDRRALYLAGVHRDIRRGICGSGIPGRGAESVVLSGGYEDDVDLGVIVYYSGQGGRGSGGRQDADQSFTGLNASLARNVDTRDPVRLVRAILKGYRYDGIFLVEDAWIGPGKSGHNVCHYRLAQHKSGEWPSPVGAKLDRGKRGPSQRVETTHFRIQRDGAIPRVVKALYDHRCQICGIRIETLAGAYAEAAHLVPLEAGGDDHTSNVLCLCPNHHVMLDHGQICLTDDWAVLDRSGNRIGSLTLHSDHGLASRQASLHRERMGFSQESAEDSTAQLGDPPRTS